MPSQVIHQVSKPSDHNFLGIIESMMLMNLIKIRYPLKLTAIACLKISLQNRANLYCILIKIRFYL